MRLYSNNLNYLKNIIGTDFDIRVYDVIKSLRREIPLPKDLHYLADYILHDISKYGFFNKYYRFGDYANFNHKDFKTHNPDFIIITSFAYCYFDDLKNMIKYLKQLSHSPIIIGGGGPSSNPEYYIENTDCDYVITGPAEISLKKLLTSLSQKESLSEIKNLYSKDIVSDSDFNMPYTIKPFINIKSKKKINIQLTRGCPGSCSYCSIKLTAGNIMVKSGIDDVTDELLKIKDKVADNVCIDIEDDNILFDKDYFRNVITHIKSIFPVSSLCFENGIDYNLLDDETVSFLVKNNISQWNISLTSLDMKMLKNEKDRVTSLEKFENVFYKLKETGKLIIVYYIAGLKNDTKENIIETLCYLSKKKALIGFSPYYSVPGTKESTGNTDKPVFCKGTSLFPHNNITVNELYTFFILTRFVNYMNDNQADKSNDEAYIMSVRNREIYGYSAGKIVKYPVNNEIVKSFFKKINM